MPRFRAFRHEALVAAYREIHPYGKREGVTHLITAMEPALARRLRLIGLKFSPMGPTFEFAGQVRP